MTVMTRLLTALCAFTLLATAYLSLSVLVLRPPRANYREWFPMAALFVGQSAITLIGRDRLRLVTLVGAAAIMVIGGMWARRTLTSTHFEAYALVLGSALVVQGALTIARLPRRPARKGGREPFFRIGR
jgi:peptidoglycan/LPS O-acetylase OafA/YrhL